jgi:hypothetical protein
MSEPPDIHELVGDDVPEEELTRLRRVDALLRSVPPPVEVPDSLERRALAVGTVVRVWTGRRVAAALAAAAVIAGVFFALGTLVGGSDGFEPVRVVVMEPTAEAAGASVTIRLGPRDESGNWPFELDASGLPKLPDDGYYVLWLARDGEWAGTCGAFDVGPGSTTVRMTASYDLSEFDEWVVTAWIPGRDNENAPWLLQAPTISA